MALIPLTHENKTKLAKYLCRSYDFRWSSSRAWEDIPEDAKTEWLDNAEELIKTMNDETQNWQNPYWPL